MTKRKHQFCLQPFQDKRGAWRWRMISAVNGKILASSEAYSDYDACADTFLAIANSGHWPVDMQYRELKEAKP